MVIPHYDEAGVRAPRWSEIETMAREAEAAGVDSLWLVDHLTFPSEPWPFEGIATISAPPYGVWECWTTIAALAAVTSTIGLGTIVTSTARRSPALLAKMATTVDEVTGGRLVLGIGAGDAPDERRMLGEPMQHLVGRFEEALSIIAPLLRGETVTVDGEHVAVHDFSVAPRGPRPDGPPILIGSLANRPRMLRLVAEYADAWNAFLPLLPSGPDRLGPLRTAVDEACLRRGRDPSTLARTVVVGVVTSGPLLDEPHAIRGSDEAIAEALVGYGERGIDEVIVMLLPADRASVERLCGAMQTLQR